VFNAYYAFVIDGNKLIKNDTFKLLAWLNLAVCYNQQDAFV
jgi:hypothetical protein